MISELKHQLKLIEMNTKDQFILDVLNTIKKEILLSGSAETAYGFILSHSKRRDGFSEKLDKMIEEDGVFEAPAAEMISVAVEILASGCSIFNCTIQEIYKSQHLTGPTLELLSKNNSRKFLLDLLDVGITS